MSTNQAQKLLADANDDQWEIDRYLLSDPTLDRSAFEQQMLADQSLAERVASSVAILQVITSVARNAPDATAMAVARIPSSRYRQATSRWALLATIAALFMAVSARQFRSASSDAQLARIATHWAAFENLTAAESPEWMATEAHASELQSSEYQTDAESYEQSDWLVEAAREFYLANHEGVAG